MWIILKHASCTETDIAQFLIISQEHSIYLFKNLFFWILKKHIYILEKNIFLVVLWFEQKTSDLLGRHSSLSHVPCPFCSIISEIGSFIPARPGLQSSYLHNWDDSYAPLCLVFTWDGFSRIFLSTILPISTSQVIGFQVWDTVTGRKNYLYHIFWRISLLIFWHFIIFSVYHCLDVM
jgi:hypothetical protein